MDFKKVIEYRQKYSLKKGKGEDELLTALKNNTYEYDYALLKINLKISDIDKILNNRYIDMIIKIPGPLVETGTNFILFHFTTSKPKKLLTGIFFGKVYKTHAIKRNNESKENKWTEDFENFLEDINEYINSGIVKREELTINDFSVFNKNNLNPYYYTKQAIKIRKEINENQYILLRDIADIHKSSVNVTGEIKYIDYNNFEYPLNYNKLPTIKLSRDTKAMKLKKGDIIGYIYKSNIKFYLYNSEYNDVYINTRFYCIIRVRDDSITNYLVNYLNDEKARAQFLSSDSESVVTILDTVTMDSLKNLKVIKPTPEMIKAADDAMKYKMNFKEISPDVINELIRNYSKNKLENESQKMINADILKTISSLKNKAIRQLISSDLNEVEICFNNKAYKSAIILCGSILEAILIDWLSEYENTNNILDAAKDDNKDLTLYKIIKRLKDLLTPDWKEATKAHEIRKTRNMVHPKECIRNNLKVNLEDCQKIIDDLYDILESKENRSKN